MAAYIVLWDKLSASLDSVTTLNPQVICVVIASVLGLGVIAWVAAKIWGAALSLFMRHLKITDAVFDQLIERAMEKRRAKKQLETDEPKKESQPEPSHPLYEWDAGQNDWAEVRQVEATNPRPARRGRRLKLIAEVVRREQEAKRAQQNRSTALFGEPAKPSAPNISIPITTLPPSVPFNPIDEDSDFFIQDRAPNGKLTVSRRSPTAQESLTDKQREDIRSIVHGVVKDIAKADKASSEPLLPIPTDFDVDKLLGQIEQHLPKDELRPNDPLPDGVPVDWDSPLVRFYRKRLGGKFPKLSGTPSDCAQKWQGLVRGASERNRCAAVLEFEAHMLRDLPQPLMEVFWLTCRQSEMDWFTAQMPNSRYDVDVIYLKSESCSIGCRVVEEDGETVTYIAKDGKRGVIDRANVERVELGTGLLRYLFPSIRRRFGTSAARVKAMPRLRAIDAPTTQQTDDVTMSQGRPKWGQPLRRTA